MATPPNGISPLHMLQAEIQQMRAAGRNLTQEVLRLQRSEIQLSAVVKGLIGGPGMEKSIPVDVVNATIPASLHLNVEDGLLTIRCSPPKPTEPPPATGDAPAADDAAARMEKFRDAPANPIEDRDDPSGPRILTP